MNTEELVFEVRKSLSGGYESRALGHSVFTHGNDWDELKNMVRDAVLCHFEEGDAPQVIELHFVHEEVILV